jgi:hypothetical protein
MRNLALANGFISAALGSSLRQRVNGSVVTVRQPKLGHEESDVGTDHYGPSIFITTYIVLNTFIHMIKLHIQEEAVAEESNPIYLITQCSAPSDPMPSPFPACRSLPAQVSQQIR